MGAVFIPNLDEGDVAIGAIRPPGTGVEQAVRMQQQLDRALGSLPEVRIGIRVNGTAEVATDPMPPARSDMYVMLKPHEQWPDPRKSKLQLLADIEAKANTVPGTVFEFSQPIQMRFNELISGVRSDVAVKIFGEEFKPTSWVANQIAAVLRGTQGAVDVKVEQVTGQPVLMDQDRQSRDCPSGLSVSAVQDVIGAAIGGRGSRRCLRR